MTTLLDKCLEVVKQEDCDRFAKNMPELYEKALCMKSLRMIDDLFNNYILKASKTTTTIDDVSPFISCNTCDKNVEMPYWICTNNSCDYDTCDKEACYKDKKCPRCKDFLLYVTGGNYMYMSNAGDRGFYINVSPVKRRYIPPKFVPFLSIKRNLVWCKLLIGMLVENVYLIDHMKTDFGSVAAWTLITNLKRVGFNKMAGLILNTNADSQSCGTILMIVLRKNVNIFLIHPPNIKDYFDNINKDIKDAYYNKQKVKILQKVEYFIN